jgi:YbaB/EbfC DNA-binding family
MAELERALRDARERLARLRAGNQVAAERASADPQRLPSATAGSGENTGSGDGPFPRGRGVAADGRILVFAARGRIERAELDPKALRRGPGDLAAGLVSACNAALDDLRAQMPAPDGTAVGDLEALAGELSVVKDQALRQMQEIVSAIQDGVGQFGRDAQVSGAVDMPAVARLFEETERLLEPLRGANLGADPHADERDEDAGGAGQAGAGGLVRAVATANWRVGRLEIDPRAIQAGSRQLGEDVVAAVNMALDDLDQRRRQRSGPATTDREELTAQVHELQDAALRQLQMFGYALSDLMRSMRPSDGTGRGRT